jgi:hypothetical protein
MRRILGSFAVYAAQDDGIGAAVELNEWSIWLAERPLTRHPPAAGHEPRTR